MNLTDVVLIFTLDIIVLIIAVVGTMMHLNRKINSMILSLDDKFVKEAGLEEKLANLPMAQERGHHINKLRKTVKKLHQFIVPRLLENSLIMAEIADKAGVSKDKVNQIKANVRNGDIKDAEG